MQEDEMGRSEMSEDENADYENAEDELKNEVARSDRERIRREWEEAVRVVKALTAPPAAPLHHVLVSINGKTGADLLRECEDRLAGIEPTPPVEPEAGTSIGRGEEPPGRSDAEQ